MTAEDILERAHCERAVHALMGRDGGGSIAQGVRSAWTTLLMSERSASRADAAAELEHLQNLLSAHEGQQADNDRLRERVAELEGAPCYPVAAVDALLTHLDADAFDAAWEDALEPLVAAVRASREPRGAGCSTISAPALRALLRGGA